MRPYRDDTALRSAVTAQRVETQSTELTGLKGYYLKDAHTARHKPYAIGEIIIVSDGSTKNVVEFDEPALVEDMVSRRAA